ncbi:hypothetical protein H0H92_009796 [Tricholoma furcatifolium]|nr:hypothetical protein H0H92_009796 [Tricholoma furcatifolium]
MGPAPASIFRDVSYLSTATWVFATDPALTGMIGGLVQGFFAWRVKILTRNTFMALVILLCAALSFFMGLATAIAVVKVPEFAEFKKFTVVVIIWMVASAVADVTITFSLAGVQRRHRSSFAKTDTRINRISRCLITSVWALCDMFLFLLEPTGMHLLFNFPLSKLYTNSLMSSLNARSFWQNQDGEDALVASSSNKTTFQLSKLKHGSEVTSRVHRDAEASESLTDSFVLN